MAAPKKTTKKKGKVVSQADDPKIVLLVVLFTALSVVFAFTAFINY